MKIYINKYNDVKLTMLDTCFTYAIKRVCTDFDVLSRFLLTLNDIKFYNEIKLNIMKNIKSSGTKITEITKFDNFTLAKINVNDIKPEEYAINSGIILVDKGGEWRSNNLTIFDNGKTPEMNMYVNNCHFFVCESFVKANFLGGQLIPMFSDAVRSNIHYQTRLIDNETLTKKYFDENNKPIWDMYHCSQDLFNNIIYSFVNAFREQIG